MAEERRVEPGQRLNGALSSRTVNTMIELVRGQRLQRLGPEGGAWPGDALPRGLEVLVRNDTGEFQATGSVLAIDQGTPVDPAAAPGEFELRPLFSGAVPASSGDVVAVLRDGADDGQVVPAVLRGLAVVALDVTDATHAFAVPIEGDSSQMESADAGNPILWAETGGTGAQYGVVLLDGGSAGGGSAGLSYLYDAAASDVALTLVAQSVLATGLIVPSAGTYIFHLTVGWWVQFAGAGSRFWILLRDVTNGVSLTLNIPVVAKTFTAVEEGEAGLHFTIAVVGPTFPCTVQLQAFHGAFNGTGPNTDWITSGGGGSLPRTHVTALKLN